MTIRVGINGFGRIGRSFWRAANAADGDRGIEIVAANDLGNVATMAHLLKYDTVLGTLPAEVSVSGDTIAVGEKKIKILAERDPAQLPWRDLGVDVVIESTGRFTTGPAARAHIEAGAQKVIISAPAKEEDITIVMGVNDDAYDPADASRAIQRVLHHQLRRADGQGAARQLRHRQGPDDHDPRLHQRPGHPGLPAQGPAPGAGRGGEHHPDHDRGGQGDRAGAARTQGQARRDGHAGAGAGRLGDRPGGRTEPRSDQGRGERRVPGRRRGAAQGLPLLHRGRRSCPPTS